MAAGYGSLFAYWLGGGGTAAAEPTAGYQSLFGYWQGGGGRIVGAVPAVIPKRVVSARTSTVPVGRVLVDVAWTIRESIGGAIVKQFNGFPNSATTGPGLEGTYLEATVTGLPETGYIELTITDSYGSTSSAGASYA